MSYVDIAIIALVVLLGLIGVLRGVKKSALSLGAFLVAFLLAFFLAKVVAEGLLGIDGVKNFVVGNGFGEGSSWSLASWIYSGLGGEGAIPAEGTFLRENFYKPIMEIISQSSVDIDHLQGMAIYLAFLLFSTICGIGIFIVVRFLLIIVTVIVGSFIGKKKSVLGRLFGFAVGAVQGGVWALVITLIFSCMGGMTFFPAFGYVEAEYEHPNAVFCQHMNTGAYAIRNNLFLPDADMYGRVAALAIMKEQEEPPEEELPLPRLEVYVDLSNLNYENQPWSIDEKTGLRVYDPNGRLIDPSNYRDIGFDGAVETILGYNLAAANLINDRSQLGEMSEADFKTLRGLIQTTGESVYNQWNRVLNALAQYKTEYASARRTYLIDGEDTDGNTLQQLNIALAGKYNNVKTEIDDLLARYAAIEETLGQFPEDELKGKIPAVRRAQDVPPDGDVPGGETDPPGGETDPPGGETDPPGGETDPPGGETDPPGGETDPPGGETDPPGGETDPPGGETDPPGGETDPPGGETDPPGGETDPPGGETDPPGGETDPPGTDTPGTDTPGTDTPGTDTPGTDTPGTDTPGTDTPGSETEPPEGGETEPSGGESEETTGGEE